MSSKMRFEISQQADVLEQTLVDLRAQENQIRAIETAGFSRIVFVARGTSDNVAAYGLFMAPMISGLEAYSMSPSLLTNYHPRFNLTGALVFAISQSGETREIVDAALRAKKFGGTVVAITNNPSSSLEAVADYAFATPAGKEIAVPATKTYTSALMALAWILGTLFDSQDFLGDLAGVPSILRRQLSEVRLPENLIHSLASSKTCVMAGRGFGMGAAFEAALKLKETTGINAVGTSVADLVHGPIATLAHGVPLLLLSASVDSPVYPGLVDLISRAKSLGSKTFGIGAFCQEEVMALDGSVLLEDLPEWLAPLVLAVPSQLLAATVADNLGLDADKPTGLNKITQTV